MFWKRMEIISVLFLIGLAACGWPSVVVAQDTATGTDKRLAPGSSGEPTSTEKKTDPERLPSDVDTLVCNGLRAEYEKCAPACGQSCESLYSEARECVNVAHRCLQ
jgi:hypothetical protein